MSKESSFYRAMVKCPKRPISGANENWATLFWLSPKALFKTLFWLSLKKGHCNILIFKASRHYRRGIEPLRLIVTVS